MNRFQPGKRQLWQSLVDSIRRVQCLRDSPCRGSRVHVRLNKRPPLLHDARTAWVEGRVAREVRKGRSSARLCGR